MIFIAGKTASGVDRPQDGAAILAALAECVQHVADQGECPADTTRAPNTRNWSGRGSSALGQGGGGAPGRAKRSSTRASHVPPVSRGASASTTLWSSESPLVLEENWPPALKRQVVARLPFTHTPMSRSGREGGKYGSTRIFNTAPEPHSLSGTRNSMIAAGPMAQLPHPAGGNQP